MNTDVLIVGSGCSGLYCALKLPRDIRITLITKSDLESNDSFLAQGGMCMLKEQSDFDSFFEDTLKAGHYENDKESVGIMINSSPEVVKDLVSYGADFARNDDGSLAYTREGAHSHNRIIFHEDVTGKEITSTLLAQVKKLSNVTLMEYTTMVDIIERDNKCYGAIIRKQDGTLEKVTAAYTVMACGGVGGLYRFSTNFRHLTGDSLAIAKKHGIELKNPDYVQIHPTTFYTKKHEDRSFLISESVRGEGAKLLDKNMNRFVDELLPRDVLTGKINPGGKLAETWANAYADTPAHDHFAGPGRTVQYREGLYVGYRYYETASDEGLIDYDSTVQYPFGYGLSYTSFDQRMGDVRYDTKSGKVSFDVTVTNTGDKAGKDVVEVYYNPPYTNVSRKDHFANAKAALAGPTDYSMSDKDKSTFYNTGNNDPTKFDKTSDKMPTTGAKNGVRLAELRGADYDDAKWDKLLDELMGKPVQKEENAPNPSVAKTEKSPQSEPTSEQPKKSAEGATMTKEKPSVREELRKIKESRKEQEAEIGTSALDKSGASDRAKSANGKTEHKQPQRKKKKPKSKETR